MASVLTTDLEDDRLTVRRPDELPQGGGVAVQSPRVRSTIGPCGSFRSGRTNGTYRAGSPSGSGRTNRALRSCRARCSGGTCGALGTGRTGRSLWPGSTCSSRGTYRTLWSCGTNWSLWSGRTWSPARFSVQRIRHAQQLGGAHAGAVHLHFDEVRTSAPVNGRHASADHASVTHAHIHQAERIGGNRMGLLVHDRSRCSGLVQHQAERDRLVRLNSATSIANDGLVAETIGRLGSNGDR